MYFKQALIAFYVICIATLSGCQQETISHQRFLQFGTIFDVSLISSNEQTAEITFNKIKQLLTKRNSEWHGWEQGSLKTLNEALADHPDSYHIIPDTLQLLLLDSIKYYELSNGLFNPAMGKLIAAWGFHDKSDPDKVLINKIKSDIPGMNDLEIKENRIRSLNPFMQLDFGAIAKGLAVRQVADLIQKQGLDDFIINAGGDIYADGSKMGKAWRVAIENPFEEGIVATVNLSPNTSIFTSGDYRRFYVDEYNLKRHHIINPKTGEPSKNISSVTIITQDPVLADVAATTLMLTKTDDLIPTTQTLGVNNFIVITEQHDVYMTKELEKMVNWQTPKRFKFHYL